MTGMVGIIGVGRIAAAVVHGLRAIHPKLRIVLSPRSTAITRALADADPQIERADSNAAVVDASSIILLAMLPPQIDAVARELRFRPDQIVVSCVAGTPLADVAALVAPARACRLVPLPMIERCKGPILLYPALPEISDLFAGLGEIVLPDDENDLTIYAAGGAVMSMFFALEHAVASWMAGRGAAPSSASRYVRSWFRALAETGFRADPQDAPGLVEEHETPGGLNEHVRMSLQAQGWFTAPNAAFETLTTMSREQLQRKVRTYCPLRRSLRATAPNIQH